MILPMPQCRRLIPAKLHGTLGTAPLGIPPRRPRGSESSSIDSMELIAVPIAATPTSQVAFWQTVLAGMQFLPSSWSDRFEGFA